MGDSQTEIIKALVKAQTEFPIIKKNRMGQQGNIKHPYADLATIVEHTRPICVKNGLCHLFTIRKGEKGDDLVTTLFHESGQTIESVYPLGSLAGMSDKEAGKRISYAKRYSLKAILSVEEEEDPTDDGWGADKKGNAGNGPRTPSQNGKGRNTRTPTNKSNTNQPRNNSGGQNRKPEPVNHGPGMSDRVTVGELKVLWRVFEQKGFNKEQAAVVIQNEFKKKNVDLTKDEFHKACDLVNSLGLALLEQTEGTQ